MSPPASVLFYAPLAILIVVVVGFITHRVRRRKSLWPLFLTPKLDAGKNTEARSRAQIELQIINEKLGVLIEISQGCLKSIPRLESLGADLQKTLLQLTELHTNSMSALHRLIQQSNNALENIANGLSSLIDLSRREPTIPESVAPQSLPTRDVYPDSRGAGEVGQSVAALQEFVSRNREQINH